MYVEVSCMQYGNPDDSTPDQSGGTASGDWGQGSVFVFGYTPVTIGVTSFDTKGGKLGEDVDVTADGFFPGEEVTFTLSDGEATGANPGLIGTGTAQTGFVDDEGNADGVAGHVSTTVNIPTTVVNDTYVLTVKGTTSGRTFVSTITSGNFEETTEPGGSTPGASAPAGSETSAAAGTSVAVTTGGTASPSSVLPVLGFALVLMGAATLLISRRVRQH